MSVKEDVERVLSQHQTARAAMAQRGDRALVTADKKDNGGVFALTALPYELERFNPNLTELADFLGAEWDRVASNPYLLAQWVYTIQVNRMVTAGIVPPSFTHKAMCARCGSVPVDFISKIQLEACVWCFSRNKPKSAT